MNDDCYYFGDPHLKLGGIHKVMDRDAESILNRIARSKPDLVDPQVDQASAIDFNSKSQNAISQADRLAGRNGFKFNMATFGDEHLSRRNRRAGPDLSMYLS